MTYCLERRAQIIMNDWLKIKSRDRLLIVTGTKHKLEVNALKKNASVEIMIVQSLE